MRFSACLLLLASLIAAGARLRPVVAQENRSHLDQILAKLSDPETSNDSAIALIKAGESDSAAKAYVAEHLPALLESYGGRGDRMEDYAWGDAARVAGELSVTGAARVLCQRIDLVTNPMAGISITYNFINRAAVCALIKTGEGAVPCVTEVLKGGTALQREEAAYVLGYIGGDEAQRELNAQLKREDDPEVRQRIQEALKQRPWRPNQK